MLWLFNLLIFPFSPFCLLDSSSASCCFLFSALAASSLLVLFSWWHESQDVTHCHAKHTTYIAICLCIFRAETFNIFQFFHSMTPNFQRTHDHHTQAEDLTMTSIIPDLQCLDEKSSESLDGYEEFLKWQLISIFTQVESQLAPLLLQRSEPFI